LPVAGLMSDEPAAAVVASLDHLHAVVRELGSTLAAPFMTLSFLALSVIPALKITDRGLVDVERFALVPFDV
jgi:adenine deaminase